MQSLEENVQMPLNTQRNYERVYLNMGMCKFNHAREVARQELTSQIEETIKCFINFSVEEKYGMALIDTGSGFRVSCCNPKGLAQELSSNSNIMKVPVIQWLIGEISDIHEKHQLPLFMI